MIKKNQTSSNNRRTFLKTISLAGVSGLFLPKNMLHASNKANSRVIIVSDAAATTGSSINASVVQTMVQSGIKSLAQNNDIGEAWKTLLPGVSASSIIAIKVNCLFTLCTHPVVTNAVADSLTQMMSSGNPFPANNIIIYDASDGNLHNNGGYTINKTTTGVRCMGTSYAGSYNINGTNHGLSTILTDQANYLINIAVLKNHGGPGVSLCMKNHLGTCDNPGGVHGVGYYGDPDIPALNALTPIKSKQMVNIIDALFGIRTGGPGGTPQFTANKILMSTDIVAVDYKGRELLQQNGCDTINRATHIDTAANATYALGTNNPANMDIINITNPTGVEDRSQGSNVPRRAQLDQNYPNPFNPSTNIQYTIEKPGQAALKIYDVNGREISTLANGFHSAGVYHAQFNGNNLSSGTYICRLQTVDAVLSRKMILAK